ncbi:MAG TPA: RAMP superfamily CRISPR-associated protein [Candidatus Saccharimonadales bacterium]|jgi:CRISPR/Cas system CSM-associated protein Csm3 (group 7 of RAMP superfamily)|nr:RAMP superfamily CRISPR-associated protein [Candidatus Saccharimonadales bacterium]
MLMQMTNEFEVRLVLKALSPLLIKDGRYSKEQREDWGRGLREEARKAMPSMLPISRASDDVLRGAVTAPDPRSAVERLAFFIPGSSLRGAWRSHLERILRGISPPGKMRVCDPFEESDLTRDSCSNYATRFRDAVERLPNGTKRPPVVPYTLACPVCKLFGHTTQAGRLKITDGERIKPNEGAIIAREHVRIDRASGQVAPHALFKVFGLQGASFETRMHLRNFELWHLQLINALLSELVRGVVPLGSGKNKGYGRVECSVLEIRLTAFGLEKPPDQLQGVAEHATSGAWHQQRYGLKPAESVPALRSGRWSQVTPWRWERALDAGEFGDMWKERKLPWGQFIPLADRPMPGAQG